jgi:hypothetical protein
MAAVGNCLGAGEPAHRPDSVRGEPLDSALSSHPSWRPVAGPFVRPTRRLGRTALSPPRRQRLRRSATEAANPSWSCSPWGLPSRRGRPRRWWSLTPPFHPYPHLDRGRGRWRSVLCGTVPRVTSGGRYPPRCPAESGPSSTPPRRTPRYEATRRGRPAGSPAPAAYRWQPRGPSDCRLQPADGDPRAAESLSARTQSSEPATSSFSQDRGTNHHPPLVLGHQGDEVRRGRPGT